MSEGCPQLSEQQKSRLEWLKHILGDPDVGHFYGYLQRIQMAEELELLEALESAEYGTDG